MEGPLRPCASCSSEPGKKRCAICKSVHYCSRECQRNHWKAHKKTCSKKVSVRSQSGSSSPPSTSSTPLPVPIKPHQRRPLKQSAMPSDLRYKYVKSADEVESNLIIFLHGAGDSYDPYLTFFRSMNLPQTSALGLTAPFALPLDMGRCWYPFIDMRDGSVLKPTKMTGGESRLCDFMDIMTV